MSKHWQLFVLGLILSISSASAAIKCRQCASTDDKCTNDPDSIQATDCAADVIECYTLVENNDKVRRGCVDTTNKCDDKNCQKCSNPVDGCNNAKNIFTCKSCDSSSDAKCSTWSDGNAILNEICSTAKCIMQIKDDKNIERRCATPTDACVAGKKCEICEAAGCNKDVYPKDRRQCYQCADSDTKCANPSANSIAPLPCTLYDEADQCYTYGTSDTAMNRGCVTDATSFTKCQALNDKCTKCAADNCNNYTFKKSQSVTCIQCAESDAACVWGHTDTESKSCPNQIEYWQTEGCYTNKISADKAVRGCIHDVPTTLDCSAGSTTCTTCNASACNKADLMDYSCYKCRSDENPSCAKKLDGESYKSEKCRNPVTQPNQGCYTERWNEIIIRSCLVDADIKTQANCKDTNYKKCNFCDGVNCNKDDPPNSSPQSLALGSGLLALALIVSRLL